MMAEDMKTVCVLIKLKNFMLPTSNCNFVMHILTAIRVFCAIMMADSKNIIHRRTEVYVGTCVLGW